MEAREPELDAEEAYALEKAELAQEVRSLRRLSAQDRAAGFRPGRAPQAVRRLRFGQRVGELLLASRAVLSITHYPKL